jgi:hypothetical protein
LLPFATVKQRVVDANLHGRDEAFSWLLYLCGVRKSEACERVADDFKITEPVSQWIFIRGRREELKFHHRSCRSTGMELTRL